MIKILPALSLLLTACNVNIDSRNGNWDCGNSQIFIKNDLIEIAFTHQGKKITEKGSLQPHNDIGYALKWDKSNTNFQGTSKAVFESSKILANRLHVSESVILECRKNSGQLEKAQPPIE